MHPARLPLSLRLFLIAFLAVAVGGCVAPYDQTSDQSISSIHKAFDAHIDSLSKFAGEGSAEQRSAEFYDSLRADIRSLRLRTEARGSDPSLRTQAALLDELMRQVDDAEKLEQSGLRSSEAWQTARDGLATNIKGFLTSELARKKGE